MKKENGRDPCNVVRRIFFLLAGSPGNNLAQAGACRYDSSLGNNL